MNRDEFMLIVTDTDEKFRQRIADQYGVPVEDVSFDMGDPPGPREKKLTILINDNVKMSPKKLAAQAVHAALSHYGIRHGAVVVLGARPGQIREQCDVVIQDAGVTELAPGTLTAGVRRDP